jgi:hypothetical protein
MERRGPILWIRAHGVRREIEVEGRRERDVEEQSRKGDGEELGVVDGKPWVVWSVKDKMR